MSASDDAFYRKHADSLLRLATVLVGPNDADDVFATAVVKVLSTRTWVGLNEDQRRGYLYRSIVNEARRWGKQAGRRRRSEALLAALPRVAPPSTEPEEVWEQVAQLSVRQRAVVFLMYYEDLDTRSVAQTLDISEGSVARHLHRARNSLRKAIDV